MLTSRSAHLAAALVALLAAGCDPGPGALSTHLTPRQAPAYYVEQGQKYFATLDSSADPTIEPDYSIMVARWEWPPWLKLTGIGRDNMIGLDKNVVKATPATVPILDCRAFAVQPFARCHMSFTYAQGACPIYEEFTFNDQGEMTFIEAWSDIPGLLPYTDPADRWAEGAGVHRLSTKVPGLGDAAGLIDPAADWTQKAAANDPEIADFAARAQDFVGSWLEAYRNAGKDFFARGCGW